MTAQDEFLDAQVRRAIALERVKPGFVRKARDILRESDERLRALLAERLDNIATRGTDTGPATTARLEFLIERATELRQRLAADLFQQAEADMRDLVEDEARFQARAFDVHIPVELALAQVNIGQVFAAATEQPMHGETMRGWFDSMAAQDIRRIRSELRIGYVDGMTTDEIVRNVIGTASAHFQDGATNTTRRAAEAIVRTAMTHYANAARATVWAENKDIMDGLRWVSTLDGRTSAVCRARDGKVYPIDKGPRPPAHPNCRSVMVAHFDGVKLAEMGRPYVRDTRTRRKREVDFRAEAKERAGADGWKGMTETQRRAAIREQRRQWADENIGQVSGDVTYQQFLERQPVRFQDEVLGKTRARLFRKGELPLDRFVDERTGHEYTIAELRQREPEAWEDAFG